MSSDEIVDEVRRVRDELIKRHSGLEGWMKHLQAMDRQRARKAKLKIGKKLDRQNSRTRVVNLKAGQSHQND